MGAERRVLVSVPALRAGPLSLGPDAAKHLAVLRLAPGDSLELFDGAGRRADATVTALAGADARVEVATPEAAPPRESPLSLSLLFAVPKGDASDRIIRACTELGVAHFIPVVSERTVAHPKPRRSLRWTRIAQEAARQSLRYIVPSVAPTQPLEEALDALPRSTDLRLVPWVPESSAPLAESLPAAAADAALLIGPEGGLTADEAQLARDHGFRTVSLGPRVLRSPTAAIAASTLLLHHLGDVGRP